MSLVNKVIADKIKNSPHSPGVYIFKNINKDVLYIGKAINLNRRLHYYLKEESELYAKTAIFLKLASSLQWIEVKSDVESLLLEINLIRTLQPKYNILSKDDKRPLFIHITNDVIPRVKTARVEVPGTGDYIGPFPSGYKLGFLLKKLRHIFPFCSCPANRKKPCMYVDLGLCPNFLNLKSSKEKANYTRSITRLKLFLQGNVDKVLKILEKDMRRYSAQLQFEKASDIKKQIDAILILRQQPSSITNYLNDSSISNHIAQSHWQATKNYFKLDELIRIEGYDIANTSGKLPTASMVVFENAYANTLEYRKFTINNIVGPNDPLMIYHTLTRRLKHKEWELPQLILIDGGIAQTKAAIKALKEASVDIFILGLAKKFERLVVPSANYSMLSLATDCPVITVLRAVRDEAHRFTTTFHKVLREKELFNK